MAGLWGMADDKTSTGTVGVAANGLVTGSGTSFTTEANVGDFLTTDAESLRIISITNTTVCHVAAQTLGGVIATASANQYTLSEKPQFVSATEVGANASQIFGVDTTEVGLGGTILSGTVTFVGSGYSANAAVTVTGGGGSSGAANAQANSIGRIAAINISNAGSGYSSTPELTIAAPPGQTVNAGAVEANGFIPITGNVLQVNDFVTYDVAATNTAITELTDGGNYYIQASNSTGVYLASTLGGAAITLTAGSNENGHTLTGETATGEFTVGGALNAGVAHAGWVRRTVGTGTKAGRVSTEVLVAGRITSDSDDDSFFPDS